MSQGFAFSKGAVLVALMATAMPGLTGAQADDVAPQPVRDVVEKMIVGPDGARRDVVVRSQKWIIHDHRTIETLDPANGKSLRIVQLAAGNAISMVGGNRVERSEGQWWTVREGESLGLQTGNDSAILWVISIQAP